MSPGQHSPTDRDALWLLPLAPVNGIPPTVTEGSIDHGALITLDVNGCVTSWNSGAVVLFGYPPEKAIGQLFYHFIDLDSFVDGAVEWELSTAYYKGFAVSKWRYAHINGNRFLAKAVIKPIWDGSFQGYSVTLQPLDSASYE
jgi:PAS domain-containing protein